MENNLQVQLAPDVYFKLKYSIFKSSYHEHGIKDFRKEEQVSRVWGKNKFKTWSRNLTQQERAAIAIYKIDSSPFNSLLRDYGELSERLATMTDSEWQDYQENMVIIKKIDRSLAKAKTSKPLCVYRRVNEYHFFSHAQIQSESLKLRQGNFINQDVVAKIKNEFITPQVQYQDPAFVSTALSEDPKDSHFNDKTGHQPILLKITVPKRTDAAYLRKDITESFYKENEVLIGRNYFFKYKSALVVPMQGKETLVVEMDLMHYLERWF